MKIQKSIGPEGIEVHIVLENKAEVDNVANAMCYHYSTMAEDVEPDDDIFDLIDICGEISDRLGLQGYGSYTMVDDDGKPRVTYSANELLENQNVWKDIYRRHN